MIDRELRECQVGHDTLEFVINEASRRWSIAFGKRLRRAREERDLTASLFAAKLGLERSAISQYEAARSLPSVTVLQNMARILGVSLDRLCFDEYDAKDEIRDKELAAYFSKADGLQHRHRTLVIEFIESLLAREELELQKGQSRKKRKAA